MIKTNGTVTLYSRPWTAARVCLHGRVYWNIIKVNLIKEDTTPKLYPLGCLKINMFPLSVGANGIIQLILDYESKS